jgi:uncharacterized protein (DUF433 family)
MAAMNALARIPPPPLKVWVDGTIRVGSSEVRIDLVVQHFKKGAGPEQIQRNIPSLAIQDVYGAIIYYLEHVEGIETYLAEQKERQSEEVV